MKTSKINSESAECEMPSKEAVFRDDVFRDDVIVLGEDLSPSGRVIFLAFAALILGPTIFCQMQEDLPAMAMLAVWAGFGSFGCWMTFIALWRKQVRIDLTRGIVIVKSGLVLPFIKRTFPLVDYTDLKTETYRSFKKDKSSTAPKVTTKFFLVGHKPLLLATRSYSADDKERERITWALGNKLQTALHRRLGVQAR